MKIQIGDKAPDFEAEAYHRGSIKNLQLSQFRTQWVILLFYPGDFTYV